MSHVRVVSLCVVAFFTALAAAGCGVETPDQEPRRTADDNGSSDREKNVDSQTSAIVLANPINPTLLYCPTNPGWYQNKATRVMKFILGGPDPFPMGGACDGAYNNCRIVRDWIADNDCRLSSAVATTTCGISAGHHTLDCGAEATNWFARQYVEYCANYSDQCFGHGVSSFIHPNPCAGNVENCPDPAVLDPEPAQLTQTLSSTNGATASAVYSNSGYSTTVVKWYSYFVWSSSPPAVGQPCSTYGMSSGGTTYRVIEAGSGNYRRCY